MKTNILAGFALALIALLAPIAAQAQQTEQIELSGVLPLPVPCTATANTGNYQAGNQVMHLENMTDTILPNPVYIVSSMFWFEDVNPFLTPQGGTDLAGSIGMAVDPQSSYIHSSGYPATQTNTIQYLKTLNILQFVGPNTPQYSWHNLSPPIAYRTGDAIIIAPECYGSLTFTPYVSFMVEGTQDFISSTPPFLMQTTLTTETSGVAAQWNYRNLIPGPTTAASQVRVRVNWPNNPGLLKSTMSHLSVCVQSAPGSPNCAAPPVELTFNSLSGITLIPAQMYWTDWVPLTVPAGSNLLVTVSFFGTTPNNWQYNLSTGYGAWASQTDSWNSATMLGTVVSQPTRTHAIDRVQAM